MNRTVGSVVKTGMQPAHLLLFGLLFLVGTMPPPLAKAPNQAPVSPQSDHQSALATRSAGNLSALAADLQGVGPRTRPGAARNVGGMWVEVDRLKQEGQNVRAIEYYLSDLEGSLRRGEQGAAASRYAANNLEHEIQALQRKLRR